MRLRKRSWIALVLVAMLASVFVGVALAESGTTGDISYSGVWKQGSGTQTSLSVKNTASPGGHTISDFTFAIAGGAQVTAISGGGCSTNGFCGNALDPGQAEKIAITTATALAGGTGMTITFNDDGEAAQPAVHIKLHGKKSKHHKKKHHTKKKKHHKKKHHK